MTNRRTARTTEKHRAPTPAQTPAEDLDARALVAMHTESPSTYMPDVYCAFTKANGHAGVGAGRVPIQPYDDLEERLDEHLEEHGGGRFTIRLRDKSSQQWVTPFAYHDAPQPAPAREPARESSMPPSNGEAHELRAELASLRAELQAARHPAAAAAPAPVVDASASFITHLQAHNAQLSRDVDEARRANAERYGEGYKRGFDEGFALGKKHSTTSAWDDPEAIGKMIREVKGVMGGKGPKKEGDAAKQDNKDNGAGGSIVRFLSMAIEKGWGPEVAIDAVKTMQGVQFVRNLAQNANDLVEGAKAGMHGNDALTQWANSDVGSKWLDGMAAALKAA